jgi:hypothetical protein
MVSFHFPRHMPWTQTYWSSQEPRLTQQTVGLSSPWCTAQVSARHMVGDLLLSHLSDGQCVAIHGDCLVKSGHPISILGLKRGHGQIYATVAAFDYLVHVHRP